MNLSLQQRIEKIFDHLYAESKIKNPESISFEFSKILHTGIYVEHQYQISPAFHDFFPYEGIFIDKKNILDALHSKYKEMNNSWRLFDKSEKINFSDEDIFFICGKLFDIKLIDKNNDILGDAIEIFRNYSIKRLGGQFFTDSTVTELALEMLGFNAVEGEKFIDICSGTGGFMLSAIKKTKQILKDNNIFDESYLAKLTINNIMGKEIDKTIAEAANRNIQTRIGKKYQYIENIDSLRLEKTCDNLFDCIATNPPFGTKTTVKDKTILENYELAYLSKNSISPISPDILFLEKNINLLKPETGRLAIVLPYQILSGPQASKIRRWILKKCIILAVIDLPAETFQPHTGTKTSLLVVKKRLEEDVKLQDANYTVFMSRPKWIGHDRRGHPVFKKNIDGSNFDEILCDFQNVQNDWAAYLQDNDIHSDISFTVKAENIINDDTMHLNALYYSKATINILNGEYIFLKNIVKNIFYPGRFKRSYVINNHNAVPFLGGSNITEHIVTTKKYISQSDPHMKQLIVHEGWILITRSGTTGIVSMVPKAWDGYAISEHVIRIVPDPSKENPLFVYAYLQTKSAQEQISKGVFGSVIDEINPEAVGNIKIPQKIDENNKNTIITLIKKFEEARDLSISTYGQAISLMNQIV